MAALSYVGGIVLFVATTISVLKVLVVPRRAWSIVASPSLDAMVWGFHRIARRMPRADMADRLLGFLGPLYLVVLLGTFLALYTVAFAALLAPELGFDWSTAFREAGSSVFTLGFQSTDAAVPSTVDIFAAATGMIVIALFIAFLPAQYTAIKDRERFVKLVQGRTTELPVSGPDLLASHYERGTETMLAHLYREGERWAAGVSETHTKYPVLLHFRAPRSPLHWLPTMVALADAAALQRATLPDEAPPETRAVIDAIDLCLGELGHTAGLDVEGDDVVPAQPDAIVTATATRLRRAGSNPTADSSAVARFGVLRHDYGAAGAELATAIAAPDV